MPVRLARKSRARWRSSPAVKRVLGASRPRRKLKTEEHDAQVALFRDYIVPRLVPNAVAFAIPNGGKRHKKVAIALKAEGGAAGVPDIFVLHRRQVYFLEMKKAKGGRVSREQRDMIARLVGAGAICAVANGLAEAIACLDAWWLLMPVGEIREMAA